MVEGEISRIPVVVLSGDDNPNTIDAVYDLGANSYLIKPGSVADVYIMVKTIQRYWISSIKFPGWK